MLDIETVHHVAVPVSDLARAKHFYGNVLGLQEIPRPAFPFAGAWYRAGDREVHLIAGADPTFRKGKGVNSQDGHLAIRVRNFDQALGHLTKQGYGPGHDDPARELRLRTDGPTGYPQMYILDPDRNVIEINAETAER
jgi:glyoxylase I family protein